MSRTSASFHRALPDHCGRANAGRHYENVGANSCVRDRSHPACYRRLFDSRLRNHRSRQRAANSKGAFGRKLCEPPTGGGETICAQAVAAQRLPLRIAASYHRVDHQSSIGLAQNRGCGVFGYVVPEWYEAGRAVTDYEKFASFSLHGHLQGAGRGDAIRHRFAPVIDQILVHGFF